MRPKNYCLKIMFRVILMFSLFFVASHPLLSQKDTSWMSPFYVFKTKTDFFNNTKTYYGRWTERSVAKITLHKNGKKFKVKLETSNKANNLIS